MWQMIWWGKSVGRVKAKAPTNGTQTKHIVQIRCWYSLLEEIVPIKSKVILNFAWNWKWFTLPYGWIMFTFRAIVHVYVELYMYNVIGQAWDLMHSHRIYMATIIWIGNNWLYLSHLALSARILYLTLSLTPTSSFLAHLKLQTLIQWIKDYRLSHMGCLLLFLRIDSFGLSSSIRVHISLICFVKILFNV